VNLVAHFAEEFGNSEFDGGVGVVAAGMFHAWDKGFVGDIHRLVDRESVQIGADGDYRAGFFALEQCDNAVMGDIGADFINSERAEPISDDASSAFFAIGEFRVLVKIATGFDESGAKSGGSSRNMVVEFGSVEGAKAPNCNEQSRQTRGVFWDWWLDVEISGVVHCCAMVRWFIEG
jgi:hypothetical protein